MPVRYEVSVQPAAHLVEVTMTITGAGDAAPLELAMAAWSPGSYLIRDYARYVRNLSVEGGTAVKRDKHTWLVDVSGASRPRSGRIVVRYSVYGHDLTVRTNHIDPTHAFLHGPATFLYVPALADQPVTVSVNAPPGWPVYTSLRGDAAELTAATVDELLDCPIHIGPVALHEFQAAGKPTRLIVWGDLEPGVVTVDTMLRDVATIMDTHAARFGGAPYDDYLFILMLSPNAYGGLEHASSSANLNTPFALAKRKSYEDLLELLSHEYFHVWNGKRLRPAALGPFDYTTEAYTRSLWVQEGITSYLDRYTVLASGVQTPSRYLERLADEWGKLQAIPGRRVDSVEEASFDAWIKLYKPDEVNINSTVSYYLKGGFVAMMLDHEIRARSGETRTIVHGVQRLWERYGASPRGYQDTDVQREIEEATGVELGDPFDAYVRGTDDPDFAAVLGAAGLALTEGRDPKPGEGEPVPTWLGVMFKAPRELRGVLDGSPAAQAGLAPLDEVIAVDGYQVAAEADVKRRLSMRSPGDTVDVSVFRRGRLLTVPVTLDGAPPNRYEIATVEAPTDAQRARFEAWLGQPFPKEALQVAATNATWC
jgi:predicted metalloprotease with PDZ domain